MEDSNVFINAALVVPLTAVLVAIAQGLKSVPALKRVPEWLPVLNAFVLGPALSLSYTFARAQDAHIPPTAMELMVAAITGFIAGQASARVYDALYTSLAKSKGPVRAARLMRTTPKRPPERR